MGEQADLVTGEDLRGMPDAAAEVENANRSIEPGPVQVAGNRPPIAPPLPGVDVFEFMDAHAAVSAPCRDIVALTEGPMPPELQAPLRPRLPQQSERDRLTRRR